jgi:DNA-binding CsgD family transcriptional regulator
VRGVERPADEGSAATETGRALFEREDELALLRGVVAAAADGAAGVIAIEGPAGIGKTRLLSEARQLAAGAGARVLTARCGELEQGLAFGVVRQLFERLVAQEPSLLEGAAAAAAPAFDGAAGGAATADGDGGKPQDDTSFSVLHGLYWLTATLAGDAPLVLALDDLQWCDEPSLRCLAYLARRLDGLAVTMLCTLRPREGRAHAALIGELVDDPLARSIRPRPLSAEATGRFVAERLPGEVDARFTAACHTATGGNPLLLGELLSTLAAECVPPDAENVSAVSELGPRALSRAVLVRLARMPADAARIARAAAVLGDEADLSLAAQLAEINGEAAAVAANVLVAAEIFAAEPRVAFVHPLVGAAVSADLPPHQRALMHGRAARLLHERGRPPGVVAVHLALAPASGEAWVCDVLERAAAAAARAGAPASAVECLRRALAEPPPPERRLQVLLDLGRAEAQLDGAAAVEHLTEVLSLTRDPQTRGVAALTLARTLLFTGRADEGLALIRRTTDELGPEADDLRRALKATALAALLFGVGEAKPAPPPVADRTLPPGAGPGAKMLAAITARRWAYAGGSAADCARLALAALEDGELIAADNVHFSVTAIFVLELADRAEAADAWNRLQQDARERGSLASRAAFSLFGGRGLLRRGELDEAESALGDALDALRLIGSQGGVHHAAFLSAVLRERGDLAGARRALEAVADPGDVSDAARYRLDALAELLLAEQRFAEALAVAQESERRLAFLVNPLDTPARSHRAVALSRLGRRDEALALATAEVELARRWGAPGVVGRALRVLGTIERPAGIERLQEAVAVTAASPAQLEHAKALTALGGALRVARRPTEAREPLRHAIDLADRLGADALLASARAELHAAGGRPRTTALTGPESLTPSERRVAERAAAGQTNREIAETLFVTHKTVESHLGNVYRKLGVRSRGELADGLAGR